MKRDEHPSAVKLERLKELRRQKLLKQLLEIDLKGVEHRVYITKESKADLTINDGAWITDKIRKLIVVHNYKIDQLKNKFIKDFLPREIEELKKMDI